VGRRGGGARLCERNRVVGLCIASGTRPGPALRSPSTAPPPMPGRAASTCAATTGCSSECTASTTPMWVALGLLVVVGVHTLLNWGDRKKWAAGQRLRQVTSVNVRHATRGAGGG